MDQYEKDSFKVYVFLVIIATLFLLIFWESKELEIYDMYTIDQIADAIYIAEGGKDARKPYGILSVSCNTEAECRRICKNTIRNNIERYTRYKRAASKKRGEGQYESYLEFLGSRYAPTSGKLSAAEKRLNHNWVPNVLSILKNKE